jgi:hypothetical protein
MGMVRNMMVANTNKLGPVNLSGRMFHLACYEPCECSFPEDIWGCQNRWPIGDI